LVSLLSKEVGKSISLPYASVVRGYESLRYLPEGTEQATLACGQELSTADAKRRIPQHRFEEAVTFPSLEMGQRMELSFDGYQVKLELVERNPEESPKIKEMTYTKCFDYDKIQDIIQFRNRCTGDRIAVMKHGSKKLKDYLIDAKIPREWRDNLILLSDGQNIMWIIGDRMSEKYKVDNHTKRIIKIEIWRNS
jgi:tRNA(Ile)-lysidine synthase